MLLWSGVWYKDQRFCRVSVELVSMVVANVSTLRRTWLLGPIKHTLSANAKMRIDK